MDGAIPKASFLFDLDGTLVDSVYQHVLACLQVPEHWHRDNFLARFVYARTTNPW